MIEYLYNAIRATAGEDITISAIVKDEAGNDITSGCHLNLYNDEERMSSFDGVYIAGCWEFTIPAAETANLSGRYWYCLCSQEHSKLNFKQPIYLV